MKEIELIEKRKLREKHFLQEDGSIIAKIYDQPVHYKTNNKYIEIDNSLIKEGKELTNKNNSFKVKFNSDNLYSINVDKYFLNFKLFNIDHYNPIKMKSTNKLISYLNHKNLLNGIDFMYEILSNKIKENIIIKNIDSDFENIKFFVETNLNLEINRLGNILATCDGNIIFKFDLPFLIDNNNVKNTFINYDLTKVENGYYIKLLFDKEWILDSNRAFPVVIDPTIVSLNDNGIYDTYIYNGDGNDSRGTQDILKAGVERINNNNRINRALIKFDLPVIGTGSQIIKAKLNLVGYITNPLTYASDTMVIHRITEPWDESTASWNTMHDKYDNRIESCFESMRTWYSSNNVIEYAENTADLTDLVQKWYTDTPNYGIMIMANREVYKNNFCQAYYSKNNNVSGDNPKPVLEIVYRNQNGIEPYMKYIDNELNVGETFINSYNGNLTAIFKVGNTESKKLPAEIGIIYNTNDVILENNTGLGKGFKFNYYQTIKHIIINNIDYLEYLDEDGTLHYFKEYKEIFNNNTNEVETITEENIYYDEDGLDLKIKETDSQFILSDKSGNKMIFNKSDSIGYFSELVDTNFNILKIYYDNSKRLIKIEDASNNEINVSYQENKIVITSIENFELRYDNNKLVSIVNSVGEISNISYNNNELISIIEDYNHLKEYFEYYNELPYRIKKSKSIGNENGIERSFTLDYKKSSTTITYDDNKKQVLTFNNYGSIASIVNAPTDGLIKNAYGISNTYGENFQYKNKIAFSSIPLKYVNNLLKNTSFENNDLYFHNSTNCIINITDLYANSGYKSLKINALSGNEYASLSINVPKNNYYNFSCYIKNDCDVILQLSYYEGDDEITSNGYVIHANTEFTRHDLNIYYSDESTTELCLKIILQNSGTCYVDDIQLEEGKIANSYNYIENSNFEDNLTGWIFDKYSESNSFSNCSIVNVDNYTKALKIEMNPECSSELSKKFNIKGKTGDTYTISFWYKNEGINYDDNPEEFNNTTNSVIIMYYPENMDEGHCVNMECALNPNKDEWQFFSETFLAEEDFANIGLSFYQSMNGNNLFLTNICLYKNVPYENFDYDTNGNLIENYDLNGSKTDYLYDDNNNLIKSKDSRNKQFVYEYDKNNSGKLLRNFNNKITHEFNENVYLKSSRIINKHQCDLINTGIYIIRSKGSNYSLHLCGKHILFKNVKYAQDKWIISLINAENHEIRIKHPFINNSCISVFDDLIIPINNENLSTIFVMESNEDNSYKLRIKDTDKYLKIDNDSLYVTTLNENDTSFDFYFEKQSNYFIESNNEYEGDTEIKKLEIDSDLNKIKYIVDTNTKLLSKRIDARNKEMEYSYDNKKRITQVKLKDKIINYEYNENNTLKNIKTPTVEYNLEYDEFLNPKFMKIGNTSQSIYNYNNGEVSSIRFSNGDEINYEYDTLNRLKKVLKFDDEIDYYYDNNDNLCLIESNLYKYIFSYDVFKRLQNYRLNNFMISYGYDSNNNIISKKYFFNNDTINYSANYDQDEDVIEETIDSNTIHYIYDELGRVQKKNVNNILTTEFSYNTNGKRTSNTIKCVKINNDILSYKYDNMNNIIAEYHNGQLKMRYVYDEYNRLIKCIDNIDRTIDIFKYDLSNNIISMSKYDNETFSLKSNINYTYDSIYKDKLTKVGNLEIVYDLNNNPIRIGNDILEWENGRELKSYTSNNYSCLYEYDYNGNRISKIVNGIKTEYYVEKDKLIVEKIGNNMIYYLRDSAGNLVGFKYNNAIYYYKKNILNDIIGIYDSSGNELVKYKYDSWGNIVKISNSQGNDISNDSNNIGNINPFRYRSYYYDKETGLYYVYNRYYNPKFCRFISPDIGVSSIGEITGYNLYEYAFCNPISYSDEDGTWPKWVKALAVGVAVIAVVAVASAVTVATGGAGCAAAVIATSALKGALIGGAIGGVAIGTGNVIVNRVKTGSWKDSGKAFLEGFSYGFAAGTIVGAVIGGGKAVHSIIKASKCWSPGANGKTAFKSMNKHYSKHVVKEGLTKNYNVIKYTNDAINFANRNRALLRFTEATKLNYLNAWRLEYTIGQGGWFTSDGKIITFWLINHNH